MHTEILDQHKIIGIDFDGTLIEHPRSKVLQQYIIDHQGDKEFHLITFRTHGMRERISLDLQISTEGTKVPLTLAHFTTINAIADAAWEKRILLERQGLMDYETGREYFGWKAMTCEKLGCTLMVDDMIDMIGNYCTEKKILCLNPDDHPGHVPLTPMELLAEWLRDDRGQYGEIRGSSADALFRTGRIVWHRHQTSNEAYKTWPPESDYCWVELVG